MHRSSTPRSPGAGRALVTGGAGFIGSHLSEVLLGRGYSVTVVDNLSTGSLENIAHLEGRPGFRFVEGSVTDETLAGGLVGECDVVFHLAAVVGVKLLMEDPVAAIETNVRCTETVLKAALGPGVKVLIASSSEVYGKGNNIPFREDDDVVLGPTSSSRWAYAASKMVGEHLALSYHREKGLPAVVTRLFNTVGPRQTGRYGMVIPNFVGQALAGEPLTVFGDGRQSRCFLYVGDAVRALTALAECPEAVGEVFNVGSTEEMTIMDLARRVLALAPGARPSPDADRVVTVPYEQAYGPGYGDMTRRVPDIAKVRRYTGWEPTYSLEQVLREVIADFLDKSAEA